MIEPHLSYIFICEDVSVDEQGRLNVKEILSRILHTHEATRMPPLRVNTKVVIGTYCEDEFATHELRLALTSPDGIETDLGAAQIGFIGGEYSPIKVIEFGFVFGQPGTFWFKVYLGDRLWGQYPLTISYLHLSDS